MVARKPSRIGTWCCGVKEALAPSNHVYRTSASIGRQREQFARLGLQEREVARLSRLFFAIDADGSGEVDLNELLDWLDLELGGRAFQRRVFEAVDADRSGAIDFLEVF